MMELDAKSQSVNKTRKLVLMEIVRTAQLIRLRIGVKRAVKIHHVVTVDNFITLMEVVVKFVHLARNHQQIEENVCWNLKVVIVLLLPHAKDGKSLKVEDVNPSANPTKST